MKRTTTDLLVTFVNSLCEEVDWAGPHMDPRIITYALGKEQEQSETREAVEIALTLTMIPALVKAWKEAHLFKFFRWRFFPPRKVIWRNMPRFEEDVDFRPRGHFKLTLRVGFR